MTAVYDRTALDVYNKTSKGYINATDLNRIESNIQTLANELKVTITSKTNWTTSDFPTDVDYARILNNLKLLQANYNKPQGTPNLPSGNWLQFEKVNAIEKNILDTYNQLIYNRIDQRYCGEFYAGEVI